jgi:ParB-like chromosome segregation protein Spo0J
MSRHDRGPSLVPPCGGAQADSQAERLPDIADGRSRPDAQGPTRRTVIVYRPTDQLRSDPANPRRHPPKQVRQIARSIETFDFNVPILGDRNLTIIAGGRLASAKSLGLEEVPTIALEHLTEAQARAFMIADNRLTEIATWDDRLLGEQLKVLSDLKLEFSLEVMGFEMGEIDHLVEWQLT